MPGRARLDHWRIPMSTPEITPQVEAAPMSEVQRIIGVFFEPAKTFADLGRKQSWWVPWLLISVLSLGWVYAVQQKIGWSQIAENNIHMSPKQEAQLEKLPPDQREKQMSIATAFTKYIMWANPVLILVFTAIFAALYWALYSFGFGAKVGFGRSMAIAMYSGLPSLIKFVLAIAFVFILNPETYNLNKPVASSLGSLFDPLQHRFLAGALSAFDLFTIWSAILVGIGFEQFTKVKRWTGFAAIFGMILFLYVVFSAIGAAMAG